MNSYCDQLDSTSQPALAGPGVVPKKDNPAGESESNVQFVGDTVRSDQLPVYRWLVSSSLSPHQFRSFDRQATGSNLAALSSGLYRPSNNKPASTVGNTCGTDGIAPYVIATS